MTPAETTVQSVVLWVAALSTLLSFGTLLWTLFSGPSKRNSGRLDAQAQRLDAHELRLGALEQTQGAAPSKDDIHGLELAMADLKGELKRMSEAMRGQAEIMSRLETVVGRHEDHLLRK